MSNEPINFQQLLLESSIGWMKVPCKTITEQPPVIKITVLETSFTARAADDYVSLILARILAN